MSLVAALYIDIRGPYPQMRDVECWGLPYRDARQYAGPWPVVAHPPCGPWGRLRHLSTKQRADLAPIAVEQVRQFGGILEHPQFSKLWGHCGLPEPFKEGDEHGFTLAVEQVNWGHCARKRTWLYWLLFQVRGVEGARTVCGYQENSAHEAVGASRDRR